MTSKRQGTFHVEVCRQLGVGPGDSLVIEAMGKGDDRVWVLKPAKETRRASLGSLKRYAGSARKPWFREEHGEVAGRGKPRGYDRIIHAEVLSKGGKLATFEKSAAK